MKLGRFVAFVRDTREGRILRLSKPTLDFLDRVFDRARRERSARLFFVTSVGITRLMLRASEPVPHRAACVIDDNLALVAVYA